MKNTKSCLRGVLCLWALLLAAAVLTAGAQTALVTLDGTVADPSGAPIPDATVTASNTHTGLVRNATTDKAGRYTIQSLPAGSYNVRAVRASFATMDRTNQVFEVGQTVTLNFALRIGSVATTVEVNTGTPLLETAESAVSTIVQTQQLDNLPDLNRSFADYAALSPGVQSSGGSIQIGNSSSFQTGINLDGNNDQSSDEGGQFVQVAQDWIQEFSVITNGAPAEYGKASGGVVNAITRSGTNSIHGRAYGYFQNSALNADPWVLPPAVATKVPYNLQRIGGMLGGPIIKNKLFYFGGYEWLNNLTTETVSIPTAFVNSYVSNGNVPSASVQNLAMLKLDYDINDANSLSIRVNWDTNPVSNSGVGGKVPVGGGSDTDTIGREFAASWTYVISAKTVNELHAESQLGDDYIHCNYITLTGLPAGNPVGNWSTLGYPNVTLGCPGLFGHHGIKIESLFDTLSYSAGKHLFKFGGDIMDSGNFSSARDDTDGDYTFGSVGGTSVPFNPANPATYPQAYTVLYAPHPYYSIPGWSYGLFGQDSWQVSKALTLNLGVRYDIDTSYSNLNKYVPAGLNKFSTGYNNVGPRIGVAWSPFHNKQNTVIRGGFGMYFDENHSGAAASYMLKTVNPLGQAGGVTDNVSATRPSLNPYCEGNPACASGTVPSNLQTDMKAILALAEENITLPNFPVAGGTINVGGNTFTLPPLPTVPGFTTPAPTSGIYNIAPNIRVPYTMQYMIGIERQLANNLEISATYQHINGYDQVITSNTNISPTTFGPVNPNFQSITTFGNGGVFTSNSLLIHAKYRSHRGDALQAAYTYGHANANGTFGLISSGTEATDPFNYSIDDGPDANDIHQILNLSGTGRLPFGFSLDPILLFSSAPPYTATTTALSVPGCLSYYNTCYPPGYSRDSLRGSDTFSLNARLANTVKLRGNTSVSGYFEAYNLTNHTNFTSWQTNVTVSTFEQPLAAGAKRQLQLGVRFDF